MKALDTTVHVERLERPPRAPTGVMSVLISRSDVTANAGRDAMDAIISMPR